MSEEQTLREDTMIYRAPTPESEETAVQDIWGKQLETRVVDASEVPAMLKDGWYRSPADIGREPKPEEAAGFVPVKGAALETAEKLIDELTRENAALKNDLKIVGAKLELSAKPKTRTKED